MSARRVVTLGVAGWVVGWVLVAAAGATLTWAVISRAGTGVSGGLDALPDASATTGAPGETVTGSTLSPSPSPPPSRSPSTGGTGGTGGPGGPGTGGPATDRPVSRIWQGAAGYVSATCHGSSIELTGATPTSGFSMEVDDAGPDRVRVEFENDDARTRVEAACVDGVPLFSDDRSGEG